MSVDPLAHKFPSWSPYNYVLNNPVRLIDPDGRSPSDGDGLENEYVRKWNSNTNSYDYTQVSTEGGNDYDIIHTDTGNIPEKNSSRSTEVVINENGGTRIAPGQFVEIPGVDKPMASGGLTDYDISDFIPAKGAVKGVLKASIPFIIRGIIKDGIEDVAGMTVKKAVNSNLPHAIEQGVSRAIFSSKEDASDILKNLTSSISKNGFPTGSFKDPSYIDRVLVPVGSGGLASYQIGKTGTAALKTVLIAR